MRIEVRSDKVIIDGYVNAVDRDSRVMPSPRGPFVERVKPGVFTRALETNKNVKMLLNHLESRQIGSTADGNVKLFEDAIGLRAVAEVTDEEVIKKARNKELRGWSFGFIKINDSFEDMDNGIQRRNLNEIMLDEVSILDNTKIPAYIGTSVECREQKDTMIEYRAIDAAVVTVDNEPPTEEIKEKPNNSKYENRYLAIKANL